jgi:hypothetical protein
MDLLLVLAFFCGLGLAAMRYGHDSRDALHSAEYDLARRGVAWAANPHRAQRRPATCSVQHRLAPRSFPPLMTQGNKP